MQSRVQRHGRPGRQQEQGRNEGVHNTGHLPRKDRADYVFGTGRIFRLSHQGTSRACNAMDYHRIFSPVRSNTHVYHIRKTGKVGVFTAGVRCQSAG